MPASFSVRFLLTSWLLLGRAVDATFKVDRLLGTLTEYKIVYPKVTKKLKARNTRSVFETDAHARNNTYYALNNNKSVDDSLLVEIGNWTFEMRANDRLQISPNFIVDWISSNKTTSRNDLENIEDCTFNRGPRAALDSELSETSDIVLTVCQDQVYGIINIARGSFFIQPLKNGQHVLYKLDAEKLKMSRDVADTDNSLRVDYKNIMKVKNHVPFSRRVKREPAKCFTHEFQNFTLDDFNSGNSNNITIDIGRGDGMMDIISENVGYLLDRTWERDGLSRRKLNKDTGKVVSQLSPSHWLELAIAADYSVVDFHGNSVQRYILALLNIVSAIYKDPSLESNMILVVVRVILYTDRKDGMVRQGNAKGSLENVNKWNRKFLSASSRAGNIDNHDVAIWLTRLDIGGPSGYAPVSGACNPARSCALIRDEGLSSAFIVAHEIAHILGMTHDGDEPARNNCSEEALRGSVMAPMVAATFHRFHWSTCSKREFHRLIKQWSCLMNRPNEQNVTRLTATIQETFTMDEQCRMEFGDGYELCRTFELPEPCAHLWCGNINISRVCKTKKGPPIEGTWCGEDKWCVNGYCELVDSKNFGLTPVVHNARDGGWGSWTSWGRCSRSCGIGVKFRTRKCDHPVPAYGGKDCEGANDDFEICASANCQTADGTSIDFRAQQCGRLTDLLDDEVDILSIRNLTWLPYEPYQENLKCRLVCRSRETGRIFYTKENLIDGTHCSYGSSDICIQGECQRAGCDNILQSNKIEDFCGVCDGNNSSCEKVQRHFQRKIRRGMTRVAILPRGANNVEVNVTVVRSSSLNPIFTLVIRDGRKRRNDAAPSDVGQQELLVVEGAAFRIERLENDTFYVKTSGRLLDEVVLSLAVPDDLVYWVRGTSLWVSQTYWINREANTESSRYVWLLGGWSPCSASCGRGTRQKTIACRDETTGRIVSRRKCLLSLKPPQQMEICNIIECDFEWVAGQWEGCTTSCGSFGRQRRELYCVHSSLAVDFSRMLNYSVNNDQLYRAMKPPRLCMNRRRPAEERECNKVPCPGRWVVSEWSTCREEGQKRLQSRRARCDPPDVRETLFNCEELTVSDELRLCDDENDYSEDIPGSAFTCTEDRSQYCFLPVLRRYCIAPEFKKNCCESCASI